MHLRRILLLATGLVLPAAVFAAQPQDSIAVDREEAASPSAEHRLSAVEIDRILDAAAAKREAAKEAGVDAGRNVFGEVGFAIGTGGYRSATVPLDDGFASFSFSTDRVSDRFDPHPER